MSTLPAMWYLLAFLGCASEVQVTPDQGACTDVDYANPAPSVLDWAAEGEGARVWRSYVFLDQSGLTFAPDFSIERGVLSVYEAWTDPEGDDTFCYEPSVTVTGYRGSLEVRWYTEDDADVPFDTVIVE